MTPAEEQILNSQLLQALTGIIQYNLGVNQSERTVNERRGGYGARKRRKQMRTEIARQRLTPQVQSPPPSTHPPPTTHPPPSSALTTNNDSELVPGANNLIFRQLGNLDQLLNDALGTQTDDVVNMDTIFEKVRELIEENNEMRDFFKKNFGKIKPRDICAGQFSSVATQTPPVARHTGHARSGAQDSVLKASQTFDHQILVAGQQDIPSPNSGGRGVSKLPGDNPDNMHEASKTVAKPSLSKLQEEILSEKFHNVFCEKDWYYNELPVQKGYELLQQFAVPGQYLVTQCDTFIFRLIWKAGDDNIKSINCYLWHYIKNNTFDDTTWNYTVQCAVQESMDETVVAKPLPGRLTHRKISQKRHFSSQKRMIFCGWCQQYQDTLHWCSQVKKWLNIDQGNLLFIRGKTRSEAARNDFWTESGSRARTFQNRNTMLEQLYREAEDYWNGKKGNNRTIEWFEENKKDFEKMNESQINDKYKRCFNNCTWSEFKTLQSLIVEMEKEQKLSANAPELAMDPDEFQEFQEWYKKEKKRIARERYRLLGIET